MPEHPRRRDPVSFTRNPMHVLTFRRQEPRRVLSLTKFEL